MSDLEINYAHVAKNGVELNNPYIENLLYQQVKGMNFSDRGSFLNQKATELLRADYFDKSLIGRVHK